MKKIALFIVLTTTLLVSCTVKSTKEESQLTFLHVQGVDIVNDKGEKILLKGVGLGNWFLPEGYMWRFGQYGDRPRRIEKLVSDLIGSASADSFWHTYRRDYVTERDIKRVAELGFNSVRPALNSRLFITDGENPEFRQEGFDLLDSLISRCTRNNIYVILDMHGAPGGQTGQNIDDSENDEPLLFMQPEKYEPILTKLWVKLAEKYKDNPTVMGYDLLNEPLPKMTGAADKYKHLLEPMYKRLTKAIREVDKRHIIILEGVEWSNDWSAFTKPFDKNLVYQFHYYCWNPYENVNSIQYYIDKRTEYQSPVWVGETGEKSAAIYWSTLQLLNENNMGWSFWPWKKLDTRKAGNNPLSIKKPEGWDSIVAYSENGKAARKEWAKAIFDSYLQNIKIENCTENKEMINAMFQNAPIKLEAENFGGKGLGISYFVKDTTKTTHYRTTESVKVTYFQSEDKKHSEGQYITLNSGEWTAYLFGTNGLPFCSPAIKIRSTVAHSTVSIWINDQLLQDVDCTSFDWQTISLATCILKKADNKLKIAVTNGKVDIDYIDIR